MDKLKTRIQENIHKMDIEEPNAATWDGLKRKLSQITEVDSLKKTYCRKPKPIRNRKPQCTILGRNQQIYFSKKTGACTTYKKDPGLLKCSLCYNNNKFRSVSICE